MNHPWTGVFPAITTQFREDESLDLEALDRHCRVLIESGVSGLIACGSLGENQALSPEEKLEVVRTAVAASGGKVPVLTGVAESSTAAACRFVDAAKKAGVDGFMVMPAMVYRADPRETAAYFRTVASAAELPWMLYNNPLSYPVDVTPALLREYADIPNLVAVKESSGDPRRITQIRLAVGDRFALFVGVDDLALETAVLGIDGWVAGTGIAFPEENQHFWNLTRAGRWDEAREIYRWFTPLLKLDVHPKFVQYIKLAVQETGLGAEWVRSPRKTLVGPEREEVLAVIHAGIRNRPRLERR